MTRSEHDANQWLATQQNGRFITSPARKPVRPSWAGFLLNVALSVVCFGGAAAIGVMLAWRF